MIALVTESPDRACPACLAAREMFEWEVLHQSYPRPLRCSRADARPVQVVEAVDLLDL